MCWTCFAAGDWGSTRTLRPLASASAAVSPLLLFVPTLPAAAGHRAPYQALCRGRNQLADQPSRLLGSVAPTQLNRCVQAAVQGLLDSEDPAHRGCRPTGFLFDVAPSSERMQLARRSNARPPRGVPGPPNAHARQRAPGSAGPGARAGWAPRCHSGIAPNR